jgi:hypothetical protein
MLLIQIDKISPRQAGRLVGDKLASKSKYNDN